MIDKKDDEEQGEELNRIYNFYLDKRQMRRDYEKDKKHN